MRFHSLNNLIIKPLSLISILTLLTACVNTGTLQAQKLAGQQISYHQGIENLVTNKRYKIAVASLNQNVLSNGTAKFSIKITNSTTHSVNFIPANILATSDGLRLKLYNYAQMRRNVENTYDWQRSQANRDLQNAKNIQKPNYRFRTDITSTHQHAEKSSATHITQVVYDPIAMRQQRRSAIRQARRKIQAVAQQEQSALASLNSIWRAETLLPKKTYSGYITVTMPKLDKDNLHHRIVLNIPLGKDHYRFKYTLTMKS